MSMPTNASSNGVEVFLELPRQPALADAGNAGNRHEPHAPFASRGVEHVLQQPELPVSADERRLQSLRPVATAELGHDAQRAPCGDGCRFALQQVFARRLEHDALLAARWVASPTSTAPGGAAF